MYRIELAPGEETVFRTIEELAVAVRNGLVTPRSRIYHHATQKWLPIEFHPHYKKALALPAARVAEAAAPRTSGHPPALETLSFAVAARVPEPPAGSRGGEDPARARPRTERSGEECSITPRQGGEPEAAHQRGAERQGTEHSNAEQAGPEHLNAKHSDAKHSEPRHAEPRPSGAKHSGAGDLGTGNSSAEQSEAGQSRPVPLVPEHPVAEHPTTEHPTAEHSVAEHQPAESAITMHPAAGQSATNQRVTAYAATNFPATENAAPADAGSPAAHPAVAHSAAEMFPTEHHEPPSHPEPAPAPTSKPSYRPDSYLPPSVRIVADDPFVAIAPESAFAPPVATAPVKPWPEMPPVRESPELPTISYPEFTPAEEPIAEQVSSSRGRRPLQVAVAMLVLAAGGYLAMSFYSPVRRSHARDDGSAPASAVADRPSLPQDSPAPGAGAANPSPDRPAVGTPAAPATSGFAAALEPRAIASGPAPILPARAGAPQQSAAGSTADSTGGLPGPIAPAPVEMPLDVPMLPSGDSLVAQPSSKSDSAMKRILRAVGGKDSR